jgi:hypothetical protein
VIDGRWPEFFIVGAPRAGTSSLWDYLDQHPQIFMSRLKEPHFFAGRKPEFVAVVSDEAAYLRLFEPARIGQIRGEASPSYLRDPAAPAAIGRVRPDARIVVMLREPVSRAYSCYWHSVRYGRESRPFLEVIRAALPAQAGHRTRVTFPGAGLYSETVARYAETFDGRVLVLFLEELAANPLGELRRTLAFLGVDETEADRVRLRIRNATSLPRNALVRRAYASPRVRSVGARIVPRALHSRLEDVLLNRDRVPLMEAEARRLLEDFYAPDAPALEQLLGRPVPWAVKASLLEG